MGPTSTDNPSTIGLTLNFLMHGISLVRRQKMRSRYSALLNWMLNAINSNSEGPPKNIVQAGVKQAETRAYSDQYSTKS